MLRIQRTTSDGAQVNHRVQQQQQHVTLAPRPLFHNNNTSGGGSVDASMMAMLPLDDGDRFEGVTQLRPQHHQPSQLRHVHHHHLNSQQQHARLSHSGKVRKIKSAGDGGGSSHHSTSSSSSSGSTNGTAGATTGATGFSRKVLKQEVTQLQQLVNGMQQQVSAATREIQELRNMVGLMVDETAQPQQQQQQPLSCAVTPLMDIYQQSSDFAFAPQELTPMQQNDLAEHFGYEADANENNTDGDNDDVQNSFYCKMEQALLGGDDDDAFQLFFQN
ncbi:hypothetical protein Gpo141_00006461 [Globisporangium polare]